MGIFITIEGPNGVGKTTFIEELNKRLSTYKAVYITKEPSETNFGQYVKSNEESFSGKCYAHLIAADRCYHLDNFIKPNLMKYDIIICDRYIESSLVLQSYDGVEKDYIWKLNNDFLIPDISIILYASGEILEKRLAARKSWSRFEKAMSRNQEIELYKQAYLYIKEKGFNAFLLKNELESDFENNIQHLIELIIRNER